MENDKLLADLKDVQASQDSFVGLSASKRKTANFNDDGKL